VKPICVPCQRFYRPKKNGFTFMEMMPVIDGALPGVLEPEKWKPYKLWRGDLYECQGCGHETVAGVASKPSSEHYMPGFGELAELLDADLKINDC
jgi:hypothetical protein